MIKMGNTYCDRFSSHFALKTIENCFPLTSQGLYWDLWDVVKGANWVNYSKFCQLGTVKKGNLVF